MDRQQKLIEESKNIVFDISKPDNLWTLNDYMLLLYLWGKLPAIPGVGIKLGLDKGTGRWRSAAFCPANQERDDHVVLIKDCLPPRSERDEKVIICQLISDFGDDKFHKLICEMKKIVVTRTTKSRKRQKLYDRISAINNNAQSLSTKVKVEALKLWFSHAITGPYCITRSLDLVTSNVTLNGGAISCETTRRIGMKLGVNNFWNFDINYFNFVDDDYYVINGGDSKELNFPKCLHYQYIGVRQPGIKYKIVSEQVVHEAKSDYINGGERIKDNLIQPVIVKEMETGIFRAKLIYGRNILDGMHDKLMAIVNGQGFSDWCSSKGWEIWNGRDEQTKLSDYRLLKMHLEQSKNDKEQLQKEILQLKRELEREKKRRK